MAVMQKCIYENANEWKFDLQKIDLRLLYYLPCFWV